MICRECKKTIDTKEDYFIITKKYKDYKRYAHIGCLYKYFNKDKEYKA